MPRFLISYTFQGSGSEIIEAESLEAAESEIESRLDDETFEPPADDYDDIGFTAVEMHPVTRDGREIWTNYVRASDTRGHPSALTTTPLFAPAP